MTDKGFTFAFLLYKATQKDSEVDGRMVYFYSFYWIDSNILKTGKFSRFSTRYSKEKSFREILLSFLIGFVLFSFFFFSYTRHWGKGWKNQLKNWWDFYFLVESFGFSSNRLLGFIKKGVFLVDSFTGMCGKIITKNPIIVWEKF